MLNTPTYFTKLDISGGEVFGQGSTADEAVKQAAREAVDFLRACGLKQKNPISLPVYRLPHGTYAYWDERGVFAVSRESGVIVAYAEIAHTYVVANLRKPLTSAEVYGPARSYVIKDGPARVRALNEAGVAPIGQHVG